jgi:adenylate cyclase
VVDKAVDAIAESLSALCAAELLQQSQRYPVAEYRFWHALTQEVAYGAMPAGRRARLHAAVAETLIETDTDRLDEAAAVVAWHWEKAGRTLDAAAWNLRAANYALRSDLSGALRRWQRTVELLEGAEQTPEALRTGVRAGIRLIRFGSGAGMSPAHIERLESEGRALADRLGDPALSGMVLLVSGSVRFFTGDISDAHARYLEITQWREAPR